MLLSPVCSFAPSPLSLCLSLCACSIMDYGNGQYPLNSGIYQFHPTYNQAEMCSQMKSGFAIKGFTPYCATVYAPTCGNGIKETGEDCDDSNACCVGCKFRAGGVCSPGSTGENLCQYTQRRNHLFADEAVPAQLVCLFALLCRLRQHVSVRSFQRLLRYQVFHRRLPILLFERCVHCERVWILHRGLVLRTSSRGNEHVQTSLPL